MTLYTDNICEICMSICVVKSLGKKSLWHKVSNLTQSGTIVTTNNLATFGIYIVVYKNAFWGGCDGSAGKWACH